MADNENQEKPKKQKKEKGERRGLGRKIKEIWSELKKVSWPTFGKVMKNMGIVLAVVAIFLVILMGFDTLLSYFVFQNLAPKSTETEAAVSAAVNFGRMFSTGFLRLK